MNIGDLKQAIGDYLQVTFRPSNETDNDANILAKSDSLSLIALNNARKALERVHDFLCAEDRAQVTVTSTGSDLSGALKWVPGGIAAGAISVKTIKGAWLPDDQGNPSLAVNVLSSSRMWTELNEQRTSLDGRVEARFPRDSTFDPTLDCSYLHTVNDRLYLQPMPSDGSEQDVLLDVVKWMDAYTLDTDTDWFTDHGSDYLMWAGIVEVNYLFQTFVPRQEGSLSSPEKHRDRTMQQLIALDSYRRDQGLIADQY